MPIYEYECEDCLLRFERLQRFSDPPLQYCPDCEGPVHRVIQPVGVIFKGSGFYVTDNRGKSSTMPSNKREGESKGDGESKSDSSSEKSSASAAAKSDSGDSAAKNKPTANPAPA